MRTSCKPGFRWAIVLVAFCCTCVRGAHAQPEIGNSPEDVERIGPSNAQCSGDIDGDQAVTVDEIVTSVDRALHGCPSLTVAAPPERLLQASQNLIAGAYAGCRLGVEAALSLSGDAGLYTDAIATCAAAFDAAWPVDADENRTSPNQQILGMSAVKQRIDSLASNLGSGLRASAVASCQQQVLSVPDGFHLGDVHEDRLRGSVVDLHDEARQNTVTAYCRCDGQPANPTDPASAGYCAWRVSGNAATCASEGCTGSCNVELSGVL